MQDDLRADFIKLGNASILRTFDHLYIGDLEALPLLPDNHAATHPSLQPFSLSNNIYHRHCPDIQAGPK